MAWLGVCSCCELKSLREGGWREGWVFRLVNPTFSYLQSSKGLRRRLSGGSPCCEIWTPEFRSPVPTERRGAVQHVCNFMARVQAEEQPRQPLDIDLWPLHVHTQANTHTHTYPHICVYQHTQGEKKEFTKLGLSGSPHCCIKKWNLMVASVTKHRFSVISRRSELQDFSL